MTLYEILQNEQRPTVFSHGPEQLYYNENSYRLNELGFLWRRLRKRHSPCLRKQSHHRTFAKNL